MPSAGNMDTIALQASILSLRSPLRSVASSLGLAIASCLAHHPKVVLLHCSGAIPLCTVSRDTRPLEACLTDNLAVYTTAISGYVHAQQLDIIHSTKRQNALLGSIIPARADIKAVYAHACRLQITKSRWSPPPPILLSEH